MKTTAIIGSTGMAGHLISHFLEEKGYNVIRAARSISDGDKSIKADVCEPDILIDKLALYKPDVIVNAVGLLQKECEERPDRGIFINSYFPQYMACKYKDTATKFIHLSTDCVFSGKNAPYTENSFKDGESVYDRTKALGEVINNKDLTFRMSIIGPDTDINGTGLFNWFSKQTGKIKGFSKAFWNGVTTLELAKAIKSAIESNLTGLYHLTPKQNIDKYTLLGLFKKYFQRDDIEIIPDSSFSIDKTLLNTRTDFNYIIPTYEKMIEEMFSWCEAHKKLYWFMQKENKND